MMEDEPPPPLGGGGDFRALRGRARLAMVAAELRAHTTIAPYTAGATTHRHVGGSPLSQRTICGVRAGTPQALWPEGGTSMSYGKRRTKAAMSKRSGKDHTGRTGEIGLRFEEEEEEERWVFKS